MDPMDVNLGVKTNQKLKALRMIGFLTQGFLLACPVWTKIECNTKNIIFACVHNYKTHKNHEKSSLLMICFSEHQFL